jgi:hypothetical protein
VYHVYFLISKKVKTMAFVALYNRNLQSYPNIASPEAYTDASGKAMYISPFPSEPKEESVKKTHFVEVTCEHQNGILAKRFFKIIAINQDNQWVTPKEKDGESPVWECPVSMLEWPDNPFHDGSYLDPKKPEYYSDCGIGVVGCCSTAFKINALKEAVKAQGWCPACKAPFKYIPPKEVIPAHLLPADPAPGGLPAPHAAAAPMGGAPAMPAPAPKAADHIIPKTLTSTASSITQLAGFVFLISGLKKLGLACLAIGTTLAALVKIDPNATFVNKIKKIALPLTLGASLSGVAGFVIASTSFALLPASLIGLGAAVTTVAVAALYAKYAC